MTSPAGFDDRYDDPDQLRDQVRLLLRYRATIALGVVLGLLGGLVLVLLRAGAYTSTSEVLVRSRTDPFSTFGVAADNQVSMGTELQIALSATVAARAATALRQPSDADALLTDLRVTNPRDTQVLRFEYTGGTPTRAARVTNAFAQAYLADRQDRSKAMVTRMTTGLEAQITALTKRVMAMKSGGSSAGTAGMQQQIGILQKRVSDIRTYDTSGGDVVRRAEPPTRPSGPAPAWLVAFGLIAGLLLGVVLAWLRSALEPRARSVGEVQGALHAPVLGILPAPDTDGDLLEVGRSAGSRAEAYRALAFRLRGGDDRTPVGRLMVVAPAASRRASGTTERGAEAVAVNLAAALAESGDDVLLVDATAAAPGLPARLPLTTGDAAPTDVPEGEVVVDAGTVGRFTLRPDSRGVTDSRAATDGRGVTGDDRPTLFLTPSLLEHADGQALARRVDGVLVVGALGEVRRDDLKRVRELISCAGGHVVGVALHHVTPVGPLRRFVDSDRVRRATGRTPATTASGPADDVVARPAAPAQDDTLSVSR
ncbi:hypothetical protein [Streptomyces muensis]|uniref:Lipopolysaccharide biosynthesis protein n=1 Tax=Streptomyces muensis TaxID=1077944 RepID=A0A9X1TJX1_STRM4|nr:hypothetical protein [Streptomyces muensis]MCF1593425.1 hypothetical protein [Streptomyces muensis]